MRKNWKHIGHLLIENQILTSKTFARVLAISKKHNERVGLTLQKLQLVTGDELATALAKQYDLQKVSNLTKHKYPHDVLQLVTCEVAMQNLIFPLKKDNSNLTLAVADPTDMKVVDNLAVNCGLHIIPCVATRNDIYAAICKNYLGRNVQEPDKDTVLVVEHEQVALSAVTEFLAKAKYNVLVANNGLAGFKEIISRKPQVILTAKVLPKFDGFSLLKSIKAIPELQSIPVILMSSELTPKEEMHVFDMGFFDYIPKPINIITLVSRVKRAFRFNNRNYSIF